MSSRCRVRSAWSVTLCFTLLVGCDPSLEYAPRWTESRPAALDAVLSIDLGMVPADEALTQRSLIVSCGRGDALPYEARLDGSRLELRLVLDEAGLASPPDEVVVRLQGAPSVHAWRDRRGALLPRSVTLHRKIEDELAPPGSDAPQLTSITGTGPATHGELHHAGTVDLVFAGRLEVESLVAANCPLLETGAGGGLAPVEPELTWKRIGERTEVRLTVPVDRGPLVLRSRSLGFVDRMGRAPEPALHVTLIPDAEAATTSENDPPTGAELGLSGADEG